MFKLIEYLDRERATISALRDYHDQMWKLENAPRQLRDLEYSMTSAKRSGTAIPVQGGGSRMEEALCEAVDRRTVVEQGYRQAAAYKSEFAPCWERLTDEERDLLRLRFVEHLEGKGIGRICERYEIGRSEAYNRSNAALRRLSKLMFW